MALNEETSFPRGRRSTPKKDESSSSTAEKKKGRKRSASQDKSSQKETTPASDFLFGSAAETESRKKSKKKKEDSSIAANPKSSLLPLGGGGVVQPSASNKHGGEAVIEALSFGKLAKGTKLLGIVRELQPDYAVLSLPNLLSGYVLKREVRNEFGLHMCLIECLVLFLTFCCCYAPLFLTAHKT